MRYVLRWSNCSLASGQGGIPGRSIFGARDITAKFSRIIAFACPRTGRNESELANLCVWI